MPENNVAGGTGVIEKRLYPNVLFLIKTAADFDGKRLF